MLDITIKARLVGFGPHLSRNFRKSLGEWGDNLSLSLNFGRPKRVMTAPPPYKFHFMVNKRKIRGGFDIRIVPRDRAIAVYAMERGGVQMKYPKRARSLMLILKEGERVRYPELERERGVLITQAARPSRKHPWVIPIIHRKWKELTPKLKDAIKLSILQTPYQTIKKVTV